MKKKKRLQVNKLITRIYLEKIDSVICPGVSVDLTQFHKPSVATSTVQLCFGNRLKEPQNSGVLDYLLKKKGEEAQL